MATAFVQGKSVGTTTGLSISAAYTSPNTAGNLLLAVVSFSITGGVCPPPTDTAGNTYVQIGVSKKSAGGATNNWTALFYVANAAAGANTVTFNPNVASGLCSLGIAEYSGGPFVLDQQAGNALLNGSFTVGSIVPPGTAELIIGSGFVDSFSATTAVGAGFTSRLGFTTSSNLVWLEDKLSGVSGSQSATMTSSAADVAGYIASFFTAATTFSISGNAGVINATVSYTGTASGSVTSDNFGNYTIPGLLNGIYTLTPTASGRTFSPTNSAQTVNNANITGVNFTPTPAGILLVQKAGFSNNTATTIPQAFASNNTLGNCLIALVASISANDITNVTDSQGNTWLPAGTTAASHLGEIWYAPNCKAGANTVTLHKAGAVNRGFIAIAEYSGISTIQALDTTDFGVVVNSATSISDSLILGRAGELIISLASAGSASQNWSGFTAGYTAEAGVTGSFVTWADNANSVSGVNSFAVSNNVLDTIQLKMAAFLPAQLPAPIPGYNFVRVVESLNKTLSPSPGTPSKCVFPGGNTAGDLILVVCNQFFPATDQITSVTDTAGNTYTKLFFRHDATLLTFTDVYMCQSCVGFNTANTVSCNFTSAGVNDSVDVEAIEYSGQLATGTILDTSASLFGSGITGLSYPITPAVAGELLFTVNVSPSGPNTWSGFGIQVNREPSIGNSNNETNMADLVSSVSGANTITVTNAGHSQIASFTIALKSAVFSISGNAGIASALVSYTGTASGSVTADGSGNYTITGLANGSYTITPSLAGFTFAPTNSAQTVNNANITGVNFVATAASTVFSVTDSRHYGNFPNHSRNVQGTLTYDVPSVDSRAAGAPVDSRAAGAPVDSRIAPNIPENSRTD